MAFQIDICPVCQTNCIAEPFDFKDKKAVECQRCGKFKISITGLAASDINKYKNGAATLSYYIKNFLKQDESLNKIKIDSILRANQLPNYEQKYNSLLNWIAKESNFSTTSVKGNSNNLASIIGAVDGKEVIEILDDIWGKRLIEVEYPEGDSLRKFGQTLGFQVHLTVSGIKQVRVINIKSIDQMKTLQYDAFISHASEDKDSFVRPLAEKLKNLNFKIWYDEFQLSIGDSLRRSIDKGLANSRYGIVILSHNFFEKNWPQYELDGLVTREVEGGKVILPIRHKVSKKEVMSYSPSLADKFAIQSENKSIDEIVEQLSEVLK